jgi:hypothetical protein
MHILLTTCTARKRPEPGPLPAGERYLDPRIDAARSRARQRGLPLFIFSGVYGLLGDADPVPWYDHALQPTEVPDRAQALAATLRQRGIGTVTALLEARDQPGWAPYHDALSMGCQQAGVRLELELWSSDD